MASLARIPFSPYDESQISTLNGWMLFLAIIHFIGAAFFLLCGCMAIFGAVATIAASPFGGIVYTLQMATTPVLGAIMLVQGVFALQARSALTRVVLADDGDQAHLSDAFKRLKLFFMLELGWFGISLMTSLLGVVLSLVAPGMSAGQGFELPGGGL